RHRYSRATQLRPPAVLLHRSLRPGWTSPRAEIFRFYFSSKSLYGLTSHLAGAQPDAEATPFVATYLATCRQQEVVAGR
ncbi:hypothetical protein ABTM01_19905, partial [Acinetobacter baumannii]